MIKGYDKYKELATPLEGVYTIETLCKRLKIDKTKAIYVIYRLRKLGFIKTTYGAGKKRIYSISLKNKQRRISYTEIINQVSPIQLASSNPHYIHGKTPSYEEALIYALKQEDIRYVIASLALFKKITNWSSLYTLAKKEKLIRKIIALYEVSKRIVKKIKKMPDRFINQAKKEKSKSFIYIIKPYSSQDFKDIEQKYKVYIPLNLSDLEDYKK